MPHLSPSLESALAVFNLTTVLSLGKLVFSTSVLLLRGTKSNRTANTHFLTLFSNAYGRVSIPTRTQPVSCHMYRTMSPVLYHVIYRTLLYQNYLFLSQSHCRTHFFSSLTTPTTGSPHHLSTSAPRIPGRTGGSLR